MDTQITGYKTDNWHIAVLIPARNEEDLLPHCLRSVQQARKHLPPNVTSDVIVVSDGSTDRTLEVARNVLSQRGIVVQTNSGCVGSARALAAGVALRRYTGLPTRCWLANTDADCEVPDTWLVDQLRIAQRGRTAIAGIVDVKDFSEHHPEVEQRFRLSYQINRDGSHTHVHGANLGVRADAYLLAGGWNALLTAEDHDLWTRLRTTGASQTSDALLKVLTSGRRIGRAPLGFAQALAAHNEPAAA
jgi:glycosyltransferase involved in cell wall biosynthesis